MRISDWSSGVCSSDLPMAGPWLSPQVVKRKISPKLLPAIGGAPRGRWSAASGLRREVLQQLGQLRRRLDRRSEEHTSELQSLMRTSYAVFCLKKKKKNSACNDMNHIRVSNHNEQSSETMH